MSGFALKTYQQESLDKLREYFRLASNIGDVDTAFYQLTRRPYRPVAQLLDPPYVCIRIPTGGGKTIMACHAISVAVQELQLQDRGIVLWLVPTNTIKDQTLNALKNRSHPYRQALDSTLDGRVSVMNVDDALHLGRGDVDSDTVIIVSTLANPRIGDTERRKIYDQNGALMPHFEGLPAEVTAKLEPYEGTDRPIPSLANLLCLRRPIVVMDEAHNARTDLSFDTLARFDPSCIIEFTATPATTGANPSNVLVHVSAAELKTAEMIKLPIVLEACPQTDQTLLNAKNKRDELEVLSKAEAQGGAAHVRPIVLVQAQKRNEELTVDAVYSMLKNDLGIPEAEIAVETGERQDLAGVDVLAPDCPVRYIITVDKLREGWDCPFAYVLCSVRDIGSKTAVEQILGRVLRMPNATRRANEDLNRAYAFVTSLKFKDTADTLDVLTKALEGNGFTRFEAEQEVQHSLRGLGQIQDGLFQALAPTLTAAQRGETFAVPQLALWVDGELEVAERTHFLQAQWQLADSGYSLTPQEYSPPENTEVVELDIDKEGRAQKRYIADLQHHLAMVVPCDIKTAEQLAVWLDKHIEHPDIVQMQSMLFLLRLVETLIKERGFDLETLARDRLRLRNAAAAKIDEHRQKQVGKAYQQVLFGVPPAQIEVGPERVFTFQPFAYPVTQPYAGQWEYGRHYYPAIGEMNDEEAECAYKIDSHPNVRFWVRNLERKPDASFWLPTSTDRFYPDFVALLDDGRFAAIEYKGAHLADGPDTEEKTKIGDLWAEKSSGKCVFAMVTAKDYDARLRTLLQ